MKFKLELNIKHNDNDLFWIFFDHANNYVKELVSKLSLKRLINFFFGGEIIDLVPPSAEEMNYVDSSFLDYYERQLQHHEQNLQQYEQDQQQYLSQQPQSNNTENNPYLSNISIEHHSEVLNNTNANINTNNVINNNDNNTLNSNSNLNTNINSNNKNSNDNDNDSDLCIICFSEKRKCVFLPCKHFCACYKCSLLVNQCPICRAPIEQRMNIYT